MVLLALSGFPPSALGEAAFLLKTKTAVRAYRKWSPRMLVGRRARKKRGLEDRPLVLGEILEYFGKVGFVG
jgi:hypothetical protein